MQLFKRVNPKLKWAIIVATVLLVLLAGYAVASLLLWRAYDQKTSRASNSWQSIQQQVDDSLISDQKEWTVKYTTIKPSVDDLAQLNCQVTPLIGWQTKLMPKLDDDYQHCQEVKDGARKLSQQLDSVNHYVDQIIAVNDVLKPLASMTNAQKQSDWAGTVKTWASAADQLANLDTSDEFSDYIDKLSKSALKVSKSWQKLVDSDKSKDAQSFESAKQELETTYEDFSKQAKRYPHSEDNIFDI